MSTISDKLSYLDVTRSKIKDTINYTGAGITESDTFRSYARTLKDSFVDIINDGTGTLYDNFPKTTDEGSNTTLNNVYEAPMELEIEGKSEQDSYSGKNKANTTGNPEFVYNATQYEKNGATVIVKNNTSTITKTYAFVEYYIDNLKPNTTYTISFDATIGNNGYISCEIMKARDGSVGSNQLLRINGSTSGHLSGQFTTPDDTSTMSINLYSLRGTYYANASVTYSNVQIEEGSETSYEPYVGGIPSPSPDYPQEIKSVSGIGNLFDNNLLLNATGWVKNEDGYYTGIALNLYNYIRNNPITGFKENTQYTISNKSYSSISNSNGKLIITYTDNTRSECYIGRATTETYYSLTTTANKTISNITFDYSNGHTLYIKYIQIEEGTIAHQYIPYGHWLPVKVSNKNLFDGVLELGTISSTGVPTSSNSVIRSKNFTKVEEGNIVISYENGPTSVAVYGYDKNYNFITALPLHTTSTTGLENAMIVNIPENIEYIKFRFNTGFTTTSIKVQIEENSTATEYIEHQEQTTLIDLNKYDENNNIVGNYEICSIGDTKDLLTIKNGKAVLNKNITNIVLNGSENWSIGTQTYNDLHYFTTMDISNFKKGQAGFTLNIFKSPYFHYISNANAADLGGSYFINNMFLVFMDFTTIVDFKTWLSTHDAEVYYVLATPETITLKGTYDVKTYEDITHISIDDDLEPNMIASGLTWE